MNGEVRGRAIISFARGFLEGAGIDQLMWGVAQVYPDLQKPLFPFPGYDPAGIHGDDVISLVPGVLVAVNGLGSGSPEGTVEGVGMLLGAFLASQIQGMVRWVPIEQKLIIRPGVHGLQVGELDPILL